MSSGATIPLIEEHVSCNPDSNATDSETWKSLRDLLSHYAEKSQRHSLTQQSADIGAPHVNFQVRFLLCYELLCKPEKLEQHSDIHTTKVVRTVVDPSGVAESCTFLEGYIQATENSTTQQLPGNDVMRDVRRVLERLAYLDLYDESDDESTETIQNLIYLYGNFGICEIHYLIVNNEVAPEVAEFVLRILGDIDHAETHDYRRWVLEQVLLRCSSPDLRDSANIGLALMDDPKSIESLQSAIDKESSPFLRELLGKTLGQLENTKNASIAKEDYT